MANKEPLWKRKLPAESLMKSGVSRSGEPHISADFKNKISIQIMDEGKAVKEYEVLAARARNIGSDMMTGVASALTAIANEERNHKQVLEGISQEIAGK